MFRYITRIIVLGVFLSLIAGSAMAQKPQEDKLFNGAEAAEGTIIGKNGDCYGNTLVLSNHDFLESRYFSVSLNYSPREFADHFDITGGSWSLVVVRGGQYAGTIYGYVEAGAIISAESPDGRIEKVTKSILQATGGDGIFDGKGGDGISGSTYIVTDLKSKKAFGTVDFNF